MIAALLISLSPAYGAGGDAETLQDAPTAEESEEPDEAYFFVYYPTDECDVPENLVQLGGNRDNPFREDEIYFFQGLQLDPEEVPDCSWIEVSGYFSWVDYYHYQGKLYSSLWGHYLEHSLPDRSRGSLWVENFVDPDVRRSDFAGAEVRFVGQFYDLCAHAEIDEAASGAEWGNLFGPCHYGPAYMLRDVTAVEVLSEPNLIIRGEVNRGVIGDLDLTPYDWPHREAVNAAARHWLDSVRQGKDAVFSYIHRNTEELDADQIEYQQSDNTWQAFLTDPARSPIAGVATPTSELPMRLFNHFDAFEEGQIFDEVLACFCIDGTCEDQWPLFRIDATRTAGDFVCVAIYQDSNAPVIWDWAN